MQQRREEFGLRTALGADAGQVMRLVLGDGMRVALVGIAVGTVTALLAAYLLRALLYRVSAFDPATFAGTVVLLLLAAIVACGAPALRAARVDPKVVLQ